MLSIETKNCFRFYSNRLIHTENDLHADFRIGVQVIAAFVVIDASPSRNAVTAALIRKQYETKA